MYMKRVILIFLMKSAINSVEKYVSDIFKEDFSMPLYDECEDEYLDNTPQEAIDYKNGLDH